MISYTIISIYKDYSKCKFWIILIIQTYVFLGLYVNKEFNIQNISGILKLNNFNLSKNKFIIIGSLLFGVLVLYIVSSENNSNFSSEGNLRDIAARAVNKASACYRSLPSDAQSNAVGNMLDARKEFSDAVKFSNMDERNNSQSRAYFNNAILLSNVVMQIGRAYGSRSCG